MLHPHNYNKAMEYQLQHEFRLVEYRLTLVQTIKNLQHASHMGKKYINLLLIHLTIRKTGYTLIRKSLFHHRHSSKNVLKTSVMVS